MINPTAGKIIKRLIKQRAPAIAIEKAVDLLAKYSTIVDDGPRFDGRMVVGDMHYDPKSKRVMAYGWMDGVEMSLLVYAPGVLGEG